MHERLFDGLNRVVGPREKSTTSSRAREHNLTSFIFELYSIFSLSLSLVLHTDTVLTHFLLPFHCLYTTMYT